MSDDPPNTYYQKATSWALDGQTAAAGAVRRARLIAAIAALIAVLEALALLLLMPLKTVTTVPVLVDRQTGYVETLAPDGRRELEANEALTQSLLAQYVAARESFNIATVRSDYRKVALWSAEAARRDYLALMPADNPASPLRRYPRTSLVETSVKSITRLGPHTELVRFETLRHDQDGPAARPEAWAAVLTYRFSNEALAVSDRWLNPLGFQVVGYTKSLEAPPFSESLGGGAATPLATNALAGSPTGGLGMPSATLAGPQSAPATASPAAVRPQSPYSPTLPVYPPPSVRARIAGAPFDPQAGRGQ